MDRCATCALINWCEDQKTGSDGCSRWESVGSQSDLVPVMGTVVKEVAAENDQLRARLAAVMGLPGKLIREAQEKEEMGCTHPEWEDGPRQSVYGVAAGLRASAEELRKVLELEQVTEGPANIIGRWPGDESDEEVNEALEELS